MDELKVSHKDPVHITKFACYLLLIYVKEIRVKRGKVHYYLDMYIDSSEKGAVKESMIKYLKKIMDVFPEEINSTSKFNIC